MTVTAHTRRYGISQQLPTAWPLRPDDDHGVRDTEAFCMEIVEKARRALGMPRLEPCDLEVTVGFALGQCVILDGEFDEQQRRKPYLHFDLWLRTALYCDIIDFWRSPMGFGRHGQHRVLAQAEQALDDAAASHGEQRNGTFHDSDDGLAAGADRLDPATLVDAADRVDARRWLQSEADRAHAEPLRGSCRDADQATPRLDDRAGVAADGRARRSAAGASGTAPFVDCRECGWRHYAQSPNGIAVWHFPAGCLSCGTALELVAA